MSYSSFKRVLGETSLERKCRFLFGACLLILITGSFWWYGSRTEELVYAKSRSTGRHLVDTVMMQTHWTAFEAKPESKLLIDFLGRNLQTQVFTSKVIKAGPNDANAARDAFETWVIEHFPKTLPAEVQAAATAPGDIAGAGGKTPPFYDRRPPDKAEYEYYQPIYAHNQQCISTCHQNLGASHIVLGASGLPAPPPLEKGDLMAVVKVVIPDGETTKALNWNRAILLATAIVTVFLAMIASYVIVRYVIVKPLKHLRDTSDEIARGNMAARAEIHTADEFEELGVAFNKMVRGLVAAQDDLQEANVTLDGKVDELAQTNMRLYEMNRLKSDFLATMSHELRTPLNSIIGFSEVLDSIKSLDDKQRRYVQNIQKSGRVLLDMINDILDLAKIESGKMEVRLADFRIDAVVQAQCDFFKPQTERKNIDLEVDVEPGLPELFQDQAKVQQVLSNLLSNAIKFTPEGGRITVRARREHASGDLLLTVADTGVGIAEEDQTAIFEKFRQGKSVLTQGDAITREYSGTGLGLSIVKELCKLLGGEIVLESQLGRGSTFTVQLPWTKAGQAKVDGTMRDNLEELIRPRRQEMQRSLERPVVG